MDINTWGTNRERGVSDGNELNANSSWEQIVIHREMQKNNYQKQVVIFFDICIDIDTVGPANGNEMVY